MATAMDFIVSTRERSSTTPGGIPVLRARETRIEGRSYRVKISIPGLDCVPPDPATTGATIARSVAEALTRNFQAGLDADGDALPDISGATWRRRLDRFGQYRGRRASLGTWFAGVTTEKARVDALRTQGKRVRANLPGAAADDKWLVLRFVRGAGWYDRQRAATGGPIGTQTEGRRPIGTVGGSIRVRNQRGARSFAPLPYSQQKPGLESGLFANSVEVRFMGGKSGTARVGIFLPAQREDYVAWAEGKGAVLADVPAEMDKQIDEMLRAQASALTGESLRAAGRWAVEALQRFGSAVEWAFG